jgi:hypothetical protein
MTANDSSLSMSPRSRRASVGGGCSAAILMPLASLPEDVACPFRAEEFDTLNSFYDGTRSGLNTNGSSGGGGGRSVTIEEDDCFTTKAQRRYTETTKTLSPPLTDNQQINEIMKSRSNSTSTYYCHNTPALMSSPTHYGHSSRRTSGGLGNILLRIKEVPEDKLAMFSFAVSSVGAHSSVTNPKSPLIGDSQIISQSSSYDKEMLLISVGEIVFV